VSVPAPAKLSGCDLVQTYNWNVDVAHAICMAESGGNITAINTANADGSVDRGLMQVNSIHADMVNGDLGSLFNPTVNLKIAYSLYTAHGFTAWSTYNNGAYRKYL
jgi:hypothetical protein